jgi:hypothetical protein
VSFSYLLWANFSSTFNTASKSHFKTEHRIKHNFTVDVLRDQKSAILLKLCLIIQSLSSGVEDWERPAITAFQLSNVCHVTMTSSVHWETHQANPWDNQILGWWSANTVRLWTYTVATRLQSKGNRLDPIYSNIAKYLNNCSNDNRWELEWKFNLRVIDFDEHCKQPETKL